MTFSKNKKLNEIKSKEWFDNAREIPTNKNEVIAFVGSWPHKGKYPHWAVTGNGKLPHPFKNDNEVEKSFRDVCVAIKESRLSEVEKINRVHLLVVQLVNLQVSTIDGKKVHGGDYNHVQHPLYANKEVKNYVEIQKKLLPASLKDIHNPESYPFMTTEINIEQRFADCRAANALFAYGLQVAGVLDIKWAYVKATTYKEGIATTDDKKKFSEDHAIVLWRKNNEIYVLDSFNIEFHGIKLEEFFKANGVSISSAYNEFVKYYKKIHPNTTQAEQDEYDRTILSSYRSKDKVSAAFFPSLVERNLRYPGIKCYHSTLKTAESENWSKLYSNIFEEQCTFPETKVFRKK
ncbi:hypothetical protein [Legionella gresilensis]|uniref:hypothetical protein n=1 Tax=Legionella gresilensis TaxID=91823 RepID=UPI00104128ED|nr:hypothetical protein [Legionella gresilensis]